MLMSPVLLCREDRQLFQVADGDAGGGPALEGDDIWIAFLWSVISLVALCPSFRRPYRKEKYFPPLPLNGVVAMLSLKASKKITESLEMHSH